MADWCNGTHPINWYWRAGADWSLVWVAAGHMGIYGQGCRGPAGTDVPTEPAGVRARRGCCPPCAALGCVDIHIDDRGCVGNVCGVCSEQRRPWPWALSALQMEWAMADIAIHVLISDVHLCRLSQGYTYSCIDTILTVFHTCFHDKREESADSSRRAYPYLGTSLCTLVCLGGSHNPGHLGRASYPPAIAVHTTPPSKALRRTPYM